MSEASTSHTTWPTSFLRLLVLLAAALVLVVLSPRQARADGLLDDVVDATEDTVGSTVAATTESVDQTISSTAVAVEQVVSTLDAGVQQVLSSTAAALDQAHRTIHHALEAAGQATNGHLHPHGQPGSMPDAVPTDPGSPGRPPHPHHPHHHGQGPAHHGVLRGHHGGAAASPALVVAGVGRSASHQATAAAVPGAHGHRVPHGGSGGATIPVGAGSRDEGGGRGGQLAAIVVAAAVLASGSNRRRRLLAVARAPNPVFPILAPPG